MKSECKSISKYLR